MITIIDYGLGNIMAFLNVYKRLNIPVSVAKNKKDLMNATKLILPGVGSFDHAILSLEKSGMKEIITDLVLNKKIPILGICIGMQILAHSSEEGTSKGLGWIDAQVKKFNSKTLPHMGWNDVMPKTNNKLFMNLENDSKYYFLHSYYLECNNKEDCLAESNYGKIFVCAVNHENIYGVQFHPEKSHKYGIQLLNNYALV